MVFQFMFFDALSPTYLEGFRAFYVFCPIFTEFRRGFASLKSGSTLPKDKAASRRQYEEYDKAKPTQQRRILVKENAIPLRRCPEYAGWRVGVLPHWLFPDRGRYHVGLIWIASDHWVERL